MKSKILLSLVLGTALMSGAAAPGWAKEPKAPKGPIVVKATGETKRVVITDFSPPAGLTDGGASLGSAVGDMLMNALVNRGVNVLERATLSEQENEKNLGQGGIVDEDTSVEFGKTLGGQIQISGKITQFGVKKKTSGLGGLGGGILGAIGGQKTTAEVSIDMRVIDLRTSKIIAGITGTGSESKSGLALGGVLGGVGGAGGVNTSEWAESQLGKAARAAVEDAANKLVPLIPNATAEDLKPVEAVVPDFATDTSEGMERLRKLTFVVLIPESVAVANALPFTAAPGVLGNVPNPTAEVEIQKALIKAGFKVKDDARLSQLRDDKWVREAGNGTLDNAQLADLKVRFGADILIVGSAIAEKQAKDMVNTSATFATGRVAARVIRMDNAQIIAIDETRASTRDTSEILAGKASIQKAASALAMKLVPQMAAAFAASPLTEGKLNSSIELEIKGLGSLKAADAFATQLTGLPGVTGAELNEMKGGIAFITVEIAADKAKKLALLLETSDKMAAYGLTVEDSSSSKIAATAAPKNAPAAKPATAVKKPK